MTEDRLKNDYQKFMDDQNIEHDTFTAFICGSKCNSVEINKLTAMLNENKSILEVVKLHGNERISFVIKERIKQLEFDLNKLFNKIKQQ